MRWLVVPLVLLGCGAVAGGEKSAQKPGKARSAGKGKVVKAMGKVVVVMEGFRGEKGKALVALFDAGKGFPDGKFASQRVAATIKAGKASATFDGLPAGVYAIGVLHDEDGDFAMGTNFLGMPTEGYAASNNARRRFGPPRWEDARFQVAADATVTQTIKLIYP